MKRYKKKSYYVKAEKVPVGTDLYNYLEDCHYKTDRETCMKITGTMGEIWPISIKEFALKYCHLDGTRISSTNIPKGEFRVVTIVDENATSVFAEQVKEEICIITSKGEILRANRDGIPHGQGDYIVYSNKDGEPDVDDRWVVNGKIFEFTYEEVTEY